MTSRYHGSKLSGSQQSETGEKNALPLCCRVQSCTGHTCRYFRVFFFRHKARPRFVEGSGSLLPRQRDVTNSPIRLAYKDIFVDHNTWMVLYHCIICCFLGTPQEP